MTRGWDSWGYSGSGDDGVRVMIVGSGDGYDVMLVIVVICSDDCPDSCVMVMIMVVVMVM